MGLDNETLLLLGRLSQNVQMLTGEVERMRSELDSLVELRNTGKGILIGVTLASSSIGASLTLLLSKLFGHSN